MEDNPAPVKKKNKPPLHTLVFNHNAINIKDSEYAFSKLPSLPVQREKKIGKKTDNQNYD